MHFCATYDCYTSFLQEWAIAEQKDVEEKHKHGKNSTNDADFVTLNADEALTKLAKHQQPLEIPVRSIIIL